MLTLILALLLFPDGLSSLNEGTSSRQLLERAPCGSGSGDNRFCYYVDIIPSSTETKTSVVIQNGDDSTDTNFEIYFRIKTNNCLNPSISYEFELIDYNAANEYLQVFDNNDQLVSKCQGGAGVYNHAECGVFEDCFTDHSLGITQINAGSEYKVRVFESSGVDDICTNIHDFSINSVLTLTCEPASDLKTSCGTNTFCYDVDIYPSPEYTTTYTQIIQNGDDSVATYFNFNINPKVTDCFNPSVSFDFELIDYDQSSEYLRVYDGNNQVIETCQGGIGLVNHADCGRFETCFANHNLGIDKIEKDSTYTIRVEESASVDDICTNIHDYSINAVLSVTCEAIETKEECNNDDADNRFCYDIDFDPSQEAEAIAVIQNKDDGIETNFEVSFNIINNNCANPTISFEFELIDYDYTSIESLKVYDENNQLIATCTGGVTDYDCGTFEDCVTDYDLGVTANAINAGESYTITIVEASGVDDLCTNVHDYSVNAILTLKCDNGLQAKVAEYNIMDKMSNYIKPNNGANNTYTVYIDNSYIYMIIALIMVLLICNIMVMAKSWCQESKNNKHKYKTVQFVSDTE